MPKPPTPVRLGISADGLLKMRGRGKRDAVQPPQWLEYGKSCKWFYADCTVTLEKAGENKPYRVTGVIENE